MNNVWVRSLELENIICSYHEQNFVDTASYKGENIKEKNLQNLE